MEERKRDASARSKSRKRTGIILVLFLLVLLVGAAGFGLTEAREEKTQKISEKELQQEKRRENPGCESMESNPLEIESEPDVTDAVERYYESLRDKSEFMEAYHNIRVYTKLGKYEDTYVAFVRYDMKIKDIYTEVPGMGTVYVTKDEQGEYHVSAKVADEDVSSFIQMIVQHEDVQALISETQEAYHEAVQSDALLQEALNDLKEAYEDSTRS